MEDQATWDLGARQRRRLGARGGGKVRACQRGQHSICLDAPWWMNRGKYMESKSFIAYSQPVPNFL